MSDEDFSLFHKLIFNNVKTSSDDCSPVSQQVQSLDKRKVVGGFTIWHGGHLDHAVWIFHIHNIFFSPSYRCFI